MWAKEWRMLMLPVGVWAMALAWFVLALFLLNYFLEYQAIAVKLAGLSNQRGATQLLLVQANQLVLYWLVLWSLFFGARSFSLERQWHCDYLYVGSRRLLWRILGFKIATLLGSMLLLTLPFWVFFLGLWDATQWQGALVWGIVLAQVLIIGYAGLLSLLVSVLCAQALTASLVLALIWLFLWVAPTLISQPQAWVAMLQWLSPFEHVQLLMQGVVHSQTLMFVLVHWLIFMTLLPIYWVKD